MVRFGLLWFVVVGKSSRPKYSERESVFPGFLAGKNYGELWLVVVCCGLLWLGNPSATDFLF